jgi:hypothetical protein
MVAKPSVRRSSILPVIAAWAVILPERTIPFDQIAEPIGDMRQTKTIWSLVTLLLLLTKSNNGSILAARRAGKMLAQNAAATPPAQWVNPESMHRIAPSECMADRRKHEKMLPGSMCPNEPNKPERA